MVDAKIQILIAFARRRLPVVAGVFIGVLAVAVVLVLLRPVTYEAQTTLWVNPRADDAIQGTDGLLSRFLLQRAVSDDVLARAATALGGETPKSVLEKLDVSALRGTNAIVIAAHAANPQRAVEIANAVATATIEQNRADVIQRTAPYGATLQAEVTRLNGAVAEASVRLTAETSTSGITARQLEVVQLQGQAATAFRAVEDFKAQQELQASAISVLERAQIASTTANSSTGILLVVGLVLGIIAATGALLLMERINDLLWTTGALGRATQSVLPSILVARGGNARPRARAVAELSAARSRSAHRAIGTNPVGEAGLSLLYARLTTHSPRLQSVMVVPISPDDDAARWVADGLALAAANANRNVIVLRSDGSGASARKVNLPGAGSVTSMDMSSYTEIETQLNKLDERTLAIMPVPCALENPLAISLSPLARAVVFVATAGSSRFREASDSALLVTSDDGTATIGVLLLGEAGRRPAAPANPSLVQASA